MNLLCLVSAMEALRSSRRGTLGPLGFPNIQEHFKFSAGVSWKHFVPARGLRCRSFSLFEL